MPYATERFAGTVSILSHFSLPLPAGFFPLRLSFPYAFLLALSCLAHPPLLAASRQAPMPPCSGPPNPAYAAQDAPLNVTVWTTSELSEPWTPPSCIGWTAKQVAIVVAAAGRFHHTGSTTLLLQRLAAVSDLATIRYWSVSRRQWHHLIDQAFALRTREQQSRRMNFSLHELRPDNALYFWQDSSSRAETGVRRLQIRTRQADRLAFEVENVSPVRLLFVTLFKPGDLQARYIITQESADTWRYYSLFRASGSSNPLVAFYKRSTINRTVAMFRYLAGIPTDREPPAAP